VSDDFSDLVRRQSWLVDDEQYHHDHHHHSNHTVKVDAVFTFGSDTLDGNQGNDLLVGDDSVVLMPRFSLPVAQAADFERFVEGVNDVEHELSDAMLELIDADQDRRDTLIQVKVGKSWKTYLEHHIDQVQMGNDLINGSDGADFIVGDDFATRDVIVTIVPGGTPDWNTSDHAWHDGDWHDHHHHGHGHDHDHDHDHHDHDDDHDHHDHDHDHDHHHHDHDDDHDDHDHHHHGAQSLKTASDVINGGAGNDLVFGDSVAFEDSTVIKGSGVSSYYFSKVDDHAEDAIDRFIERSDGADYWLELDDDHDHDHDDDDDDHDHDHHHDHHHHHHHDHGPDSADIISGGDGDDVLFGLEGDDKLYGNNGNDYLNGGDGHDHTDGGPGSDKENGNAPFDIDGDDHGRVFRSDTKGIPWPPVPNVPHGHHSHAPTINWAGTTSDVTGLPWAQTMHRVRPIGLTMPNFDHHHGHDHDDDDDD
jgi:Ca2+-binding RTX toxin-like protein